jgi:hypothetical protein
MSTLPSRPSPAHRFPISAIVLLSFFLAAFLTATASAQGMLPARRAEEKQLQIQLDQVDAELNRIVQAQDEISDKERKKLLAHSQLLNNMRDTLMTRLKDIARDIRETQTKEVADMFAGTVDVFLEVSQVASGNTPITHVTFSGLVWLEDRRFVRLKAENGTVWTIDPSKVAAIRSSPATQPAPGNL